MNAELCRIKVKNRISVDKLLAERIISANGIDFFPCVFCHICNLMENFSAAQSKIPAGNIQAGHEQITAGGRLRQVNNLAHISRMYIWADQKQARLCQTAAALVHGN